jgi:hypothetical protein
LRISSCMTLGCDGDSGMRTGRNIGEISGGGKEERAVSAAYISEECDPAPIRKIVST